MIFLFQDFMQGYPLQSWLPVVLRALGNEPQIHYILEKKSH